MTKKSTSLKTKFDIDQAVIVDGKKMNLYGRCPIEGIIVKFSERPYHPKDWVKIKLKKHDKLKGISMPVNDMKKYVKVKK